MLKLLNLLSVLGLLLHLCFFDSIFDLLAKCGLVVDSFKPNSLYRASVSVDLSVTLLQQLVQVINLTVQLVNLMLSRNQGMPVVLGANHCTLVLSLLLFQLLMESFLEVIRLGAVKRNLALELGHNVVFDGSLSLLHHLNVLGPLFFSLQVFLPKSIVVNLQFVFDCQLGLHLANKPLLVHAKGCLEDLLHRLRVLIRAQECFI